MSNFTYDSQSILEEVKSLIAYSISHQQQQEAVFDTMHRAIIKKYFEAKNVRINYDDQSVDLDIPVGKREYTKITFECQDLECFLSSCLKKDEKSLFFYQNMLIQYNALSAA